MNGKLALSEYEVPDPSAAVFQPANVKPVRVNAFEVSAVADPATWAVIDPTPLLESKVTTRWPLLRSKMKLALPALPGSEIPTVYTKVLVSLNVTVARPLVNESAPDVDELLD